MKESQTEVSPMRLDKRSKPSAQERSKGEPAINSVDKFQRCVALRAVYSIVLLAISVLYAGVLPAWAQQSSDVTQQQQSAGQNPSVGAAQTQTAASDPKQGQNEAAGSADILKQSQNPIANLVSVPFENDWYPQTGFHSEDEYVLEVKPVVPLSLSKDWLLVERPIIPVIQEPDLAPGIQGTTGLGDVELETFLSPKKAGPGRIIWGVGPVISFPTATESILGTKKLSIGPDLVVLRSQGHLMYGALAQNLWSVEGPSERPNVNQFLMQPFVFYNLPHKWYLVSSPIMTANWEVDTGRWMVPVGGGGGRLVHLGRIPVNVSTQFFGNAMYPNGTSRWSARFQAQFLFPKKRREE